MFYWGESVTAECSFCLNHLSLKDGLLSYVLSIVMFNSFFPWSKSCDWSYKTILWFTKGLFDVAASLFLIFFLELSSGRKEFLVSPKFSIFSFSSTNIWSGFRVCFESFYWEANYLTSLSIISVTLTLFFLFRCLSNR